MNGAMNVELVRALLARLAVVIFMGGGLLVMVGAWRIAVRILLLAVLLAAVSGLVTSSWLP